jgi:hypothetical protein
MVWKCRREFNSEQGRDERRKNGTEKAEAMWTAERQDRGGRDQKRAPSRPVRGINLMKPLHFVGLDHQP